MKKIILLTVISLGIFALAGCGNTAEKANTAETQNNSGKANTAATRNEEPAVRILKPGDVSSDKAVKVIELVDSIAADKAAWTGKEVAVTGYVSGTSSSGNNQLLTLTNDKTTTQPKSVSCGFQGDLPEGVAFETVEVKGKIKFVQMDGETKRVNLEPCELKK